jgi:type II secretory pathway pseudopilin PulG
MAQSDEPTHTTVIEKRGSGGVALIAIAILAIIAVAAYFLVMNDTRETDAVTGAAQSVGQAADQAGEAATGAAK